MKSIRIATTLQKLNGIVILPSSKSISNRVLVIRALTENPFVIQNLSDADDTILLESLFESSEKEIYVRNAGTVARFLLAYYASRKSDVILSGSERMNERPIGELVEALKTLGGDIEYLNHENHLPVHIYGQILAGGPVSISAETSSQFISALLLIAPILSEGLTINMKGGIVSEPYIELTLKIMSHFGIKYVKEKNQISVPPQKYLSKSIFVESDWSSASYFFAFAALFPGTELQFDNLYNDSWQGDSILKDIMKDFGIETSFVGTKCTIKSKQDKIEYFRYDFINYPDLIPTFVCLCCALQLPFTISGTRTLKHKESDRAEVLKTELGKLGYTIECKENTMVYDGSLTVLGNGEVMLNTHLDHRMAMSFAILAAKNPDICIENTGVVEKSFPGFWKELTQIGFEIAIE